MKKETAIVASLITLFFVSIMVALLTTPSNPDTGSFTSDGVLSSKPGIAVLELMGPIAFSQRSQSFGLSSTESFLDQLEEIEKDKRVKGLLIRINSPGGTVGASQELYNAIKGFKERKQIPIVATIGDIGTSGAYYAALASDTIFANPGSMVGSIGVIMGNINFTELAKRYGVDFNVYKSGPYKDIMSSWRKSTDKEARFLNEMVDDVHQQFVDAVIASRKMTPQQAKSVTDGRFFTGRQSKQLGLIDELGGMNEALLFIGKKAELEGKPHIISKDKKGFYDFMSYWGDNLGAVSIDGFLNRMTPSLRY